MKEHNISYMDVRISHDRLDIFDEINEVYDQKAFPIKFIVQFIRAKMSDFNINVLLND